MYSIHFGILPIGKHHRIVLDESDPFNGQEVNLNGAGPGYWSGHVDGTWETWGEEAETRDSVHFVIRGVAGVVLTVGEVGALCRSLKQSTDGRVADLVLVTTEEDDSEKVMIFDVSSTTTYRYVVEGFRSQDSAALDELAQFQGFADNTDVNGGDLVEYVGELLTSTGRSINNG